MGRGSASLRRRQRREGRATACERRRASKKTLRRSWEEEGKAGDAKPAIKWLWLLRPAGEKIRRAGHLGDMRRRTEAQRLSVQREGLVVPPSSVSRINSDARNSPTIACACETDLFEARGALSP